MHEEHKAAWKNGKHQDQWINTLTTYAFPKLGDRLVNDIERQIIRDMLAPIWLAMLGPPAGFASIGAVLDWSYAKGYRPTEAPMRSLSEGLPGQPRKD